MKQVLVIYNQASGRRRHPHLIRQIKNALRRRHFNLEFKNYENFIADARLAEKFNYQLVVVAGGDGTIRHVATFLLQHNLQVPLALVPIGTANMLAQSLGIPLNVKKALALIPQGKTHAIDIGLINGQHYFLDAFCIGYIAERILAAERRLKDHLGFWSYIISFLFNRKMPHYDFSFTVDGQAYRHEGNSLFIANTQRLFSFTPRKRISDLQDGKFELTVAINKNFWSFFEATYYYYFHQRPPRHLVITEGSKFTLETNSNTYVQIDGDYLECPEGTITIEILRQKLLVIKKG